MIKIYTVVGALLLSACGHVSPTPVGIADAAVIDIHIEMIAEDLWRVRIQMPEPTRQIIFRRTPSLDIRERWQILGSGKALKKIGKRDVVVSDEPFTAVVFEVAADDRRLRADYMLTQTFADDGGVVLYLGHFVASQEGTCPDAPNAKPPCPTDVSTRFHIKPRAEEHVWLSGELHKAPFTISDLEGESGMAYFGSRQPRQEGIWQILAGPNVPAWMLEDLSSLTPKVTGLYTQWLGVPLMFSPQLLFSLRSGSDYSSTGGVIDEMVHFVMSGDVWQQDSPMARARYFDLISHEAAHLWNASMFSHDHDTGASWMHEGGAESLKRRVGVELGKMNAESLWAARALSFNQCLIGSKRPLNKAGSRGNFSLYYPCGEVIDLVVEGALRKLDLDPHAHWQLMFATLEGEYSSEKYMAAVLALTDDDYVVDTLNTYVEKGFTQEAEFVALMRHVGIKVQGAQNAPTEGVLRATLGHLHRQDCGGGFSIIGHSGTYTLLANKRCQNTPHPGLEVARIAGFDISVSENVYPAFQAVVQACDRGDSIKLAGKVDEKADSMDVVCSQPLNYTTLAGWQEG